MEMHLIHGDSVQKIKSGREHNHGLYGRTSDTHCQEVLQPDPQGPERVRQPPTRSAIPTRRYKPRVRVSGADWQGGRPLALGPLPALGRRAFCISSLRLFMYPYF